MVRLMRSVGGMVGARVRMWAGLCMSGRVCRVLRVRNERLCSSPRGAHWARKRQGKCAGIDGVCGKGRGNHRARTHARRKCPGTREWWRRRHICGAAVADSVCQVVRITPNVAGAGVRQILFGNTAAERVLRVERVWSVRRLQRVGSESRTSYAAPNGYNTRCKASAKRCTQWRAQWCTRCGVSRTKLPKIPESIQIAST